MKVLFYLISSIIIVATNYTFAEEAPSNIYKPKYEILKYKIFREFPDKAKMEQEWKAMPFDSLTLERRGCFGECPIFSVTFYRGGKASYNGIIYTKLKGEHSGEVRLYDYALLSSYIERVGMTDFIGPYRVTWTDDETVIVKININDTLKEIKDYGHQAPPEFQAFVALFEKICDEIKWNKLEK